MGAGRAALSKLNLFLLSLSTFPQHISKQSSLSNSFTFIPNHWPYIHDHSHSQLVPFPSTDMAICLVIKAGNWGAARNSSHLLSPFPSLISLITKSAQNFLTVSQVRLCLHSHFPSSGLTVSHLVCYLKPLIVLFASRVFYLMSASLSKT